MDCCFFLTSTDFFHKGDGSFDSCISTSITTTSQYCHEDFLGTYINQTKTTSICLRNIYRNKRSADRRKVCRLTVENQNEPVPEDVTDMIVEEGVAVNNERTFYRH